MAAVYSSTLIPFETRTIGDASIPTVDGRDLHEFLGIARDYNAWMRQQITRAHLIKGRDFTTYQEVGSSRGGRAQIDYYLTFDAAKHVAMLSGSKKGHEVREYFLACEKTLEEQQSVLPHFHNPQTKMLIETLLRIDTLEAEQSATREMLLAQQAELIAHQQNTIEALSISQRAEAKANRAVEEAQWMSIRQYVYLYDLMAQLPASVQKDYGIWLSGYCVEQNIPTYKAQPNGQQWSVENTYPVMDIKATLQPWLHRRQSQITLVPKV